MSSKNYNDIRCSVCLTEFKLQTIQGSGAKTCPICHTMIEPLFIANDVIIEINWQSLRVLATYSKRWSKKIDQGTQANRDMVQALENILTQLKHYRPLSALPLITAEKEKEAVRLPMRSPYFNRGRRGGEGFKF